MTQEVLRQATKIANLIELLERQLSTFENQKVQKVTILGDKSDSILGQDFFAMLELDYSVPYDQQCFIATLLRPNTENYFTDVKRNLKFEIERLKKKLEEL